MANLDTAISKLEEKVKLARTNVEVARKRVDELLGKMQKYAASSDAASTDKVVGVKVQLKKAQEELAKAEGELQKLNTPQENHPPKGQSDSKDTLEDKPVNGKVNFTDDDGDSVTVTVYDKPKHGTVTVNIDGNYEYTPSSNYHGPDSFTVKGSDGKDSSNPVVVSINVHHVEDAPIANPDYAKVTKNSGREIDVLYNDDNVDGGKLGVKLVKSPSHGTAKVNDEGKVEYTPATDYVGSDEFTYMAYNKDGKLVSNATPVSINVAQGWGEWFWGGVNFYGPKIESGIADIAHIGQIFDITHTGWELFLAKKAQNEAIKTLKDAQPPVVEQPKVEVTQTINTNKIGGKGVVGATAAAINAGVDEKDRAAAHDTQAKLVYNANADKLAGSAGIKPDALPNPHVDIKTDSTTTSRGLVDGKVVSEVIDSSDHASSALERVTKSAQKAAAAKAGTNKQPAVEHKTEHKDVVKSKVEAAKVDLAETTQVVKDTQSDLGKRILTEAVTIVVNSDHPKDAWGTMSEYLGVAKSGFDTVVSCTGRVFQNAWNGYSIYSSVSHIKSVYDKSKDTTAVASAKLGAEVAIGTAVYYGGQIALDYVVEGGKALVSGLIGSSSDTPLIDSNTSHTEL